MFWLAYLKNDDIFWGGMGGGAISQCFQLYPETDKNNNVYFSGFQNKMCLTYDLKNIFLLLGWLIPFIVYKDTNDTILKQVNSESLQHDFI